MQVTIRMPRSMLDEVLELYAEEGASLSEKVIGAIKDGLFLTKNTEAGAYDHLLKEGYREQAEEDLRLAEADLPATLEVLPPAPEEPIACIHPKVRLRNIAVGKRCLDCGAVLRP